jgi:hypothetical protein
MGLETEILKIINIIQPHIYWVFLELTIIAIIVIIFKRICENIANYFLFRWDKTLGNGVKVIVNGNEGVIENYDKVSIYIRTNTNDVLIIPISRWRLQSWVVKSFDKQ